MANSNDLEKKGPVIYVTPVPNREGSFMCSIKKNKNPSEDEQTCEIMAMGMMRMCLTDPSYVYDLGLEALAEEEESNVVYKEPVLKGNGNTVTPTLLIY